LKKSCAASAVVETAHQSTLATKDIKMVTVLGKIFGAVIFFVLFSFLLSWPVMMLWNGCLVDAVEGVREISWLQAWGINFLCGLLFNKASSK
jgi:hypothetical protein